MYRFLRSLLFLFSPEFIHGVSMFVIKLSNYIPGFRYVFSFKKKELEKEVFGINFKNPLGFAAGFDKNAEAYNGISNFGFSFVEIGTVTPLPQTGNPHPRLFRLTKDQALINRMGFNNLGLEAAIAKLKQKRKKNLIIGGNIGKNTATPNNEAVNDFVKCFKGLYAHVDYFVVNVSCPNVACLQKLQEKDELEIILKALTHERNFQDIYKPILLKISPDLTFEQIDDTIILIREFGIDGVVAANTTTSRENLHTSKEDVKDIGNGGLSGAPLTKRAIEIVKYIYEQTSGTVPIVGVGGIMSTQDAINMMEAGANLIQIYTGFIYKGPLFSKQILKAIYNKEKDKVK